MSQSLYFRGPLDTNSLSHLVLPSTLANRLSCSITQELGFEQNARVLIVHADDLGLAHSVNEVTFTALEQSVITSAAVMVPCPWFPEVVEYTLQHDNTDIGIHLTLTSEWQFYRWGPIAPREEVPTLLDDDGYFHNNCSGLLRKATVEHVEIEVRAQIDRALSAGIRPTHIDTHMLCLFQSAELYTVLLNISKDYDLPCLTIPSSHRCKNGHQAVDGIIMANEHVSPAGWQTFYALALESLQPGIHELVVHLGSDDAELRAITVGHPHWNASWRQRDLDFIHSPRFKSALANSRIHLTGWRAVRRALRTLRTRQQGRESHIEQHD